MTISLSLNLLLDIYAVELRKMIDDIELIPPEDVSEADAEDAHRIIREASFPSDDEVDRTRRGYLAKKALLDGDKATFIAWLEEEAAREK